MLEPELCEKFITKAQKIKNTKLEIFILFLFRVFAVK